eukprot:TRINITY_DN7788_c0_g1_i1.p1 TRINITY_DN7788_c0_g1~~TRINITY_DN7788_c0_g1_i1.p1  ORF type:complete len:185 (-),score=55.26 TRINITY_DN7788_c0_g1_i1:4-558(-)
MRARLLIEMGKLRSAYSDIEKALEFGRDNAEAQALLIRMKKNSELFKQKATQLALVGKFTEAINTLTDAIDINRNDVDLLIRRGTLYRQKGDIMVAIKEFRTALKMLDKAYEEGSLNEVDQTGEGIFLRQSYTEVMNELQYGYEASAIYMLKHRMLPPLTQSNPNNSAFQCHQRGNEKLTSVVG